MADVALVPPAPIAVPPAQPLWQRRFTAEALVVALLLAGFGVVMLYACGTSRVGAGRLWAWASFAAMLALFVLVAGRGITGVWRGAFIDDVNTISLSRLQLIIWTIVVVSGFMAAALSNVLIAAVPNPLVITIPNQLLQLLGISTASFVGATLIAEPKKAAAPTVNPDTIAKVTATVAAQNNVAPDSVSTAGVLLANKNPDGARWSDLVTGEEIANGAHLDISRVQMLFFTLVLVAAYAVALGKVLGGPAPAFGAFPGLDDGMIALLGISHVGYLTVKAAPKSPATTTG
jgi:hypothetical protein